MSRSRPDPYRDLEVAYAAETSARESQGARVVRTTTAGSNRTPVPRPGRDWTVTGRCAECKGPIVELRRGADYATQTEHRPGCSQRRKP